MTVSIEVSRSDAKVLYYILAGSKQGHKEALFYLKKIKESNPERKLGPRNQTTEEAIKTTQQAIETIDRVLEQLHEYREQ